MKIKIIYLFIMFLTLSCAGNSLSKETVKGTVIATPQNIISAGIGEKIITNLGKNNGVIVGDILKLVESDDDILIGNVGKCAVIRTDDLSSVCEIIKLSTEIGMGDYVYINKLDYMDHKIYPSAFALLNEVVNPYEPQNKIHVFINNIYDENNNITALSERIKSEIIDIFSQKKRITVNQINISDYINYPDNYFYTDRGASRKENIGILKGVMKRADIDVIITGTYKIDQSKINLTLYIIDKNWSDRKLHLTLDGKYSNMDNEIIIPYAPKKEKEYITYNITCIHKNYFPSKDEKREIIKHESDKDILFRYKISDKKIDFNRIGPENFKLKIDGELINIIPDRNNQMKFEKGMKRMWLYFQPGFFMNEELFYTSETKNVEKEIIIDLKREDNLDIKLILDPTYGKEKVEVIITRKIPDESFIAKAVYSEIEKKPAVDVYRD